jgi:hypothetical protein
MADVLVVVAAAAAEEYLTGVQAAAPLARSTFLEEAQAAQAPFLRMAVAEAEDQPQVLAVQPPAVAEVLAVEPVLTAVADKIHFRPTTFQLVVVLAAQEHT